MPVDHRERAFESAIERHLVTHGGYTKAEQAYFDQERALDSTQLIPFIQETQKETWDALVKLHGAATEKVILDDLCKAVDTRGSLDVLRHSFKCYGKTMLVSDSPSRVADSPPREKALCHGKAPAAQHGLSYAFARFILPCAQRCLSARRSNPVIVASVGCFHLLQKLRSPRLLHCGGKHRTCSESP